MFELLFKYPSQVFSRGTFVLLNTWPMWLFALALIAAAVGLGWLIWRPGAGRRASAMATEAPRMAGPRALFVWLMQTAMAALLLFLLWHPAISVATLKPQQNIVAVVVDDSQSMAIQDEGSSTRKDAAEHVLNSSLIKDLQTKFQVRLYRMSDHLERIDKLDQVTAQGSATHIGDSLKQVVDDAASLPIGAVVLLSDGADNSGGIDLDTISEIRRQRIPVHTIGFGKEKLAHDIEITDAEVPARALPDSRLAAMVHLHQHGYAGQKVHINIKEGGKLLASQEVTLKADGVEQVEQVLFSAGPVGVKVVQVSIDPQTSEENVKNNSITELVSVDDRKPRILYFEGEPRWEFKFLRRAVEDDKTIRLTTDLRTTQDKMYRQLLTDQDPNTELVDGFPSKVQELFQYEGLILGSVDQAYLKPEQQMLIHEFVDRRGGGLLLLGGKDSLADGGYSKSGLNDLLPVVLPETKAKTYVIDAADVELTKEGRESLITRLEEDPDKNVERWKKLPYLMNFQDPGTPKPGATVLVNSIPKGGGGRKLPLLITQPFGLGRTAIFATAGSWRWQMLQPVADMTHEMFYRQLLRWLVNNTPKRVTGSTPHAVISDTGSIKIRAEVRDTTYLPAGDANVQAHILGPDGVSEMVDLHPEPLELGLYSADWTAPKEGSYTAEISAKRGTSGATASEDLGSDTISFRREDGVAEHFHVEQNRELLEKLSSETGGRYYRPDEAGKLAKDITYSEAGITVRETRDLWDMPVIFLMIAGLRAAEWMVRRKWGVI